MRVTGIVAALTAEARTLGPLPTGRGPAARLSVLHTLPDGNLLALSGMGPEAAGRASQALISAGAQALLSFGLAGALDPALRAGAVLLPGLVIDEAGTRHATSQPWYRRLATLPGAIAGGTLLSLAAPLTTPAAKSQAWTRTGAAAVDMESAAVATVAAQSGVPFAAARVIIDSAADRVPRSVTQATDAWGEVAYLQLLGALLRRPGEVLPVLILSQRYRRAMRALYELARHGVGMA